MESIPEQMRYSAMKAGQSKVVRQRVQPSNNQAYANNLINFDLPPKSLLDLSTVSVTFQVNCSNLATGATTFFNCKIPSAHQFFRRCQWSVGGIPCANVTVSNYDIIYHALLKASADEAYCKARLLNGNQTIISASDDSDTKKVTEEPAATTKSVVLVLDNLVGMRSACSVLDSSLFGNVSLSLQVGDISSFSFYQGTGTAGSTPALFNFYLSNIYLEVDVIQSVSPLYIELLSTKLSSKTDILYPYENIVSSAAQNINGANKLTLQSDCIDAVMVVALDSTYSLMPVSGSLVANYVDQPNRYKFNSSFADSTAAKNGRFWLTVNGQNYPSTPLDDMTLAAEQVCNAIYGSSSNAKNLLFSSTDANGAVSLSRSNFLQKSWMHLTKFVVGTQGWQSKILQGLSSQGVTSDIVVNTSGFSSSNYFTIAALCTSVLKYDGQTSSVSVIA